MRLLAAPVVVALLGAGCAASTASRQGREAEFHQDYDRAVVEYTTALRLRPDDGAARAGLERAKVHASEEHLQRARRLSAVGKLDEALVEYSVAGELNPTSATIDDELRSTRNKLRVKVAASREGKTQLQTLIDRTRDLPPPGLDLPQNVRMPASLTFRDASSRDVFTTIARFAGISLIFDTQFREAPVTVDLRNATLDDALSTVAGATRSFFRVTAPQTVVVIPDTPAKRREYEEEIVRTFYLSNADLKETMDLLRLVLDARRISPITATNALTIKDTPEHIAAAARVLSAIDKARPEVIINVELLEIDRTKLLEYGLQIASPGSPGLNGSASIAPAASQTITLQTLKNLSQSDILLASLPGLYYRLLKTDSNTRTLANPQLRTSEGLTATARFGDKIPVPVTTFAPIATGGTPQQPITSYAYENIGVNIDITPRTHHDDDVTLQLSVAVTSISGTGFGGLPTFGNREIKTTIRLRDGETNMLAGLIRDDERRSLDGIPGLSDLPILGPLFAHSQKQTEQTDIILTLTPHIVRVLDLTEADLRPFRVGRDSLAPLAELPLPLPVFTPTVPEPTPGPPPGPGAPPPAPPPSGPAPTPGPIARRQPGTERSAGPRIFLRTLAETADRYHPHADAALRPRARSDRGRSPAVQGRPRLAGAAGRVAVAGLHAHGARTHTGTASRARGAAGGAAARAATFRPGANTWTNSAARLHSDSAWLRRCDFGLRRRPAHRVRRRARVRQRVSLPRRFARNRASVHRRLLHGGRQRQRLQGNGCDASNRSAPDRTSGVRIRGPAD